MPFGLFPLHEVINPFGFRTAHVSLTCGLKLERGMWKSTTLVKECAKYIYKEFPAQLLSFGSFRSDPENILTQCHVL
jgi:hypothetical protein